MPLSCHDVYGDRFVRIVPTYSVVGMLFDDPAEPKTIVRSTGDGALQHDPTTWQVHADCLDEADDLLPQCKLVNAIFDKWMLFTRQVFDAFEAGGATTFDEVMGNPASTQRVLAALRDADPRTKELLGELVQVAAGKTWDATVAAVASATRAALSAVGAMLPQHRLAKVRRPSMPRLTPTQRTPPSEGLICVAPPFHTVVNTEDGHPSGLGNGGSHVRTFSSHLVILHCGVSVLRRRTCALEPQAW